MTTRSQSVAELERRMEENRSEANTRMDQLQERVDLLFEELRNLILSQTRASSLESNHTPLPGTEIPPRPPPVTIPEVTIRPPPKTNTPRSYSTRLSKVDFPRFDGKKVKDWLYKCDQFFLLDETPPESRVRLASIHLEGVALQWHLNYLRGRFDQYPLWPQYAADVRRRFGDLYEDPLAELIQVKHSSSIQSYVDDFELALTQVSILPEHALSIFLASLDPQTQAHVRMFNPTTMAHAINLAKLHDATKPSKQNPYKPYP